MSEHVNESRFYMWRAIFAMAHADGVVTPEETEFLTEYMTSMPFSDEQRKTLMDDLGRPQDIGDMFSKIEDPADRTRFFFFARMLVWSDGDFDAQERRILDKLKKAHLSDSDLDRVTRDVRESAGLVKNDMAASSKKVLSFRETMKRFQENFKGGE